MNGLLNVRVVKVLVLGVLLTASTWAVAGKGDDRGRSHGHSKGYQSQQHGGYRGHSNRSRGREYAGHHGRNAYSKHGRKHHKNRHHVQPKYYGNRHRHSGRYCNINHYPGYVTRYAAPVYVPRPPAVVLYPPRVGIYFGGRIDF